LYLSVNSPPEPDISGQNGNLFLFYYKIANSRMYSEMMGEVYFRICQAWSRQNNFSFACKFLQKRTGVCKYTSSIIFTSHEETSIYVYDRNRPVDLFFSLFRFPSYIHLSFTYNYSSLQWVQQSFKSRPHNMLVYVNSYVPDHI